MLLQLVNVVYVLVAIAMIGLILMQRGSGAQAGSGFGGGASATVFGARGASNFLSKSTKWLAIVFFGISLFMAWYASHGNRPSDAGLGVMSQVEAPVAPAGELQSVPQATVPVVAEVPQAAAPVENVPEQGEEKPAESAQKD